VKFLPLLDLISSLIYLYSMKLFFLNKRFLRHIIVKATKLSRVMTKSTYCVCDQHGSRPACASAHSDQNPCCSLTNPITSRETDSEQHGSWSDCADAQAGLDLCWSDTHYVGFVMARLKWWCCIHLVRVVCLKRLSYIKGSLSPKNTFFYHFLKALQVIYSVTIFLNSTH
jgi:hypothetical protein